jgi:cytochrome c oxidase subunit 2
LLLTLLLACLVATGCDTGDKMSTFDVMGPVSQIQLGCFYASFWVSVLIFVVVGSLMVFTIFRFRHSVALNPNAPLPPQTHGSAPLEIALTAVSVLLLVVIAVPTLKGIVQTAEPPDPDNALHITVKGYQWWWAFEYPNGVVTANELHIPLGKSVVCHLKSMDVIHSFWVPKLAGKVDVIPGQHNELWLRADVPGKYYGQCAEFCGDSHADMRFRVITMYDNEYNTWLAHQKAPAEKPSNELEQKGYEIFMKGPKDGQACSTCHTIGGTPAMGLVGPNLTHVGQRTTIAAGMLDENREGFETWLTHLGDVKPGNKMLLANLHLTDDEVKALSAYLVSLR